MIYACGLPSEGTFARFLHQAEVNKVPVLVLDTRKAAFQNWYFPIKGHEKARVWSNEDVVELDPEGAYFCRIINTATAESNLDAARRTCAFNVAIHSWLDSIPGTVANRSQAGRHNSSKPLHESVLVDLGFSVPESLTTCDLSEIREFLRQGRTISKTVCGVRAHTVEVSAKDFVDFEAACGPVHLQRLVEGSDARVHVIGEFHVAQKLETSAIDYRASDEMHKLKVCDLHDSIASQLVSASHSIELAFSGWDFKIDAKGRYWCLEVNPMPGYGLYDRYCRGKISDLLLHFLSGQK
jgi:hypothetical protein